MARVQIELSTTGAEGVSSSFRKISAEVAALGDRVEKGIKPQLVATESAFRSLGLGGSEAFQKLERAAQSDKIRAAFDTIRKSSLATTEEVTRAGRAMEEKLKALGTGAAQSATGFGTLQTAVGGVNSVLVQAGVSTGILGQAIGALTSPLGLVAIGFGAVATAAAAGVNAMVANANEVRNLMAVSGLAANEADNLADTFALLGKDGDTLRNALFKMGTELESGGAAVEKLGISLRDTSGAIKTEGALLLEVRDSISKMGSASERSAALTALFGRAGRELADVFSLSAEKFQEYAQQAGIISEWNGQMQQSTQEFILAQAKLRLELEALAQMIGRIVIPPLTDLVKTLSNLVALARDPITFTIKTQGAEAAAATLSALAGGVPLAIPGPELPPRLSAGGMAEDTGGGRPIDPRILAGELASMKAQMDGRLEILKAGLAREQAARQLAVAQGSMTEEQAAQGAIAGIERMRAAEQQAFAERFALMAREGATQAQRETASAKFEATMLALDTQRLGSMAQVSRSAKSLNDVLVSGTQKLASITAAVQSEDVQRLAAVSAEFESLAKKAEELSGKGSAVATRLREMGAAAVELTKGTQAIKAFGDALKTLEPVTQALAALGESSKLLSEVETTLQPLIAALAQNVTLTVAEKDAILAQGRAVAEQIQLRRVQKQSLADSIEGLGDEAKAWGLDKDAMRGYQAQLGPFLEDFSAAKREATVFAAAMAEVDIQAKVLGSDFDAVGARVQVMRAAWERAVDAFQLQQITLDELTAAGGRFREALADQRLYKDIEAGFLSITDTFTKMADGLIAGTLEIGDAFANLGRNLLTNFVQIVIHQVFDPLLKEAASFVTKMIGILSEFASGTSGGSGGWMAAIGTAAGAVFKGASGMGDSGAWVESATGLLELQEQGTKTADVFNLVFTAAQTLYSGITNLPTILTAAQNAWEVFNFTLAVGGSALESASAGWSAFSNSLGAGVGALSGVIAAVGALYSLYQSIVAFQEGRTGAGIGGIVGLVAGGVIGAIVGNLPGLLVGAAIGGAAGGLLGGLFDADKEMEQINLGRANQRTRTAQLALSETSGRILGATGTEQFMASLQQPIIGTGASTGDVLKKIADLVKPGGTGITFEGGVQFTLPPEMAERISTSLAAAGFTGAEFSSGRSGRVGSTTELIAATGGENAIQKGIENWQVLMGGLDAVLKALPVMDVSGLGLTQSLLVVQAQETADAFMRISDALGVAREAMPDFIHAALSVASDQIPSALAALLDTLRKGVVESATKALLAEPVKIAAILDLPALAREGEETAETFQRMVVALSGLDDTMQTLEVTTASLRGELSVSDLLAKNIAKVTEAMDAANIALATTQDPEKMLAAAQELGGLIEQRYKLELDAVEQLTTMLRSQMASMGGGLTALAQAAPVLRSLGIEVGGMTDALADVIDVLGDVGDAAGQLQTLGQVAAAFSAEVAGASPDQVLASTRALAQGLSATTATVNALTDAQQRVAGLSQILGTLTAGYEAATAALAAHFAALRAQEEALFADRVQTLESEIEHAVGLVRAYYGAQREALTDLLAASRQWETVASRIRDQVRGLQLGPTSPLNPAESLRLVQEQFAAAQASFAAKPTAAGAETVAGLGGQVIEAAAQVFSRPSPAFEALFTDVTSALAGVAASAEARVTPEEDIVRLLTAIDKTEATALDKLGFIDTSTAAALKELGFINTDIDLSEAAIAKLAKSGLLTEETFNAVFQAAGASPTPEAAEGAQIALANLIAGELSTAIEPTTGAVDKTTEAAYTVWLAVVDVAGKLAGVQTAGEASKASLDALKVEHGAKLDAIRVEEALWNAELARSLGVVAEQAVGTTAAVYAGTDASWATAVAVGGVWGAIGALQYEITRTHNELVKVLGPETTLAEFEAALNMHLHDNLWQLGQDIHASLKTLVGDSIDRLLAQGGPQAVVDALDGLDDITTNTKLTVGWLESLTRGTFKGEIPYRAFHGGTLNAPGGPALLERGEVVVPSSVSAATWFRQLGWAAAGPAGGAPTINIVIHEAKDAQDTARLVRRALDDYDRKWRDRGRS